MEIVKNEESKPSYLSIYHIAINLLGYISLYNALIELNEQTKNNKNFQYFMNFANISMLKDMAIELNELYKFMESIAPNVYNNFVEENIDFKDARLFIKQVRDSMKFELHKKTVDDILEKSKNKYPTNILKKKKNDIVYYCGYFLGENLVFGSNLYYEYILRKPFSTQISNENLYKYSNTIMTHLEWFYRFFESYIFNNNVDIPIIRLKERKRFFQIYNQTTSFNKMLKKSKYNKYFVFTFMLLIEEISNLEIYLDYMIDLKESIKDPVLLYFFTQFVAIKYDQITDSIKYLTRNETKFGVDSKKLSAQINKLNIFDKKTRDFARNLRNFHHHEEVEKYEAIIDKEKDITFDFKYLYLMVTESDDWNDFEKKLFNMKKELHILVKFLRNNIGIRY